MEHLNIEIKARCGDVERIRNILESQHANFKGRDHQIDTYFRVNIGRLKLREGNIENFVIFYDREEAAGPKQSRVILFENNPLSSLKEILTRSLGVLVVVDKQREIYFLENVKFHLDDVKGLGTFVEIEATAIDHSIGKDRLLEQCNHYAAIFQITSADLISKSYSDLLLQTAS